MNLLRDDNFRWVMDNLMGNSEKNLPIETKMVPTRVVYETYPIQYLNQTEPEFIGIKTVYEQWNEVTNRWEFWHKKEQLFRKTK
jgi:hypothetical protein